MRRVRRRGLARQRHGLQATATAEMKDAVVVRSNGDLQRLSASIANPNRRFPVVAFAQQDGALSRFLSHADVAALADAGAEVYAIAGQSVIDRLNVPTSVGFVPLTLRRVSGWVWWHYAAHPPILARAPERDRLSELRDQLDRGRPAARTRILELEQMVAQFEAAFADNVASCAQESLRADVSESSLLEAWERLACAERAGSDHERLQDIAEMDCEDQLHALIFREWLRLEKSSRASRPLSYAFLPGFVETVEAHPQLAVERLARTCALIACGQSPPAARMTSLVDVRTRAQTIGPALHELPMPGHHDGLQYERVAIGPTEPGAPMPYVHYRRSDSRPAGFSRISIDAS